MAEQGIDILSHLDGSKKYVDYMLVAEAVASKYKEYIEGETL